MGKKGVSFLSIFLILPLLGGCAELGFVRTVDAETGKETTTWDAATAKETIDDVRDDLSGGGSSVAVIISGLLACVSAGLGVAVKVQNSSKNKTIVALQSAITAAAKTMSDDDVQKMIALLREHQSKKNDAVVDKTVAGIAENNYVASATAKGESAAA